MLQDVLGAGVRRPRDQLHEVRALRHVPARFATRCASRCGKPRPAATRSASRCGKTATRRRSATRSASRCGKPRPAATRCASRSGKPRQLHVQATICYTVCKPVWETKTRCYTVCKPVWEDQDPLLHGVQAGWETKTREDLLHGVQAGVGNQDPLLHGVQAGLGRPATREVTYYVRKPVHYTKTITGASRPLGNRRRTRSPARFVARVRPRARLLVVQSVHLLLLLLPRQVPHRVRASARRCKCCKKVWVPECIEKEICCTKYVCEALHEDLLLQGLQDGARDSGPAATRSATWCPSNAPRPAATRSARWCPKTRRPAATRSATWCPSNARPAATRSATWCPSNAPRPAATRSARWCRRRGPAATRSATWCPSNGPRPAATRSARWCPRREDLLLQGLPHGARATRPGPCCYTVCKPVCYQKTIQCWKCVPQPGALHGHPVRAPLRVQAGSGVSCCCPLPCCCCDSCGDGGCGDAAGGCGCGN